MQRPVTPLDVEAIIQHSFGSKAVLKSITLAPLGDVNSCYVIETNNPKAEFFLKIENSDLLPIFYRGQIQREVASRSLLSETEIPIPSLVNYDTKGRLIGRPYLLTEFIKGQSLSDVWWNLDPAGKKFVKLQVLEIIDAMKEIHGPYFGDLVRDGSRGCFNNWASALFEAGEVLMTDCRQLDILNEQEVNLVSSMLSRLSLALPSYETSCFNHMDIHWQNILIDLSSNNPDKPKVKAVIDFGNAMFGPSYTDENRLSGFFFLKDVFFDESMPPRCRITDDEQMACELIYGLEWMVYEAMVGTDWNLKKSELLTLIRQVE